MPDRPALAAEPRTETGKIVKRLRAAGRLPAVVYGHDVPSESLSLDARTFDDLRRHAGPNALIDLKVSGTRATLPVLVHDVQVHPVTRRPLHVDLFAVRMTEEIIVDVRLVPTGSSTAVSELGGTLLHQLESVRVRALPGNLPQSIEYAIDALTDFEQAVHVRDLPIPGDVTLLTDVDELVARVQAPRVEVEEEPEVEEAEGEAAEGAEGAEGPADAGGAPVGSGGGAEGAGEGGEES
jgi:large subunit ribosomal protein L25